MPLPRHRSRLFVLALGAVALIAGWLFYGSVRGLGGLFQPAAWLLGHHPVVPSGLPGSLPSFLHAFSLVLLTAGAFGWTRRRALLLGGTWFGLNLLWELGGATLDLPDVAAAFLGASLATGLLVLLREGRERIPPLQFLKVPILGLGIACMIATSPAREPYSTATHDPILMSYAELRASFSVQPPRSIVHNGKILTAGPLLFVNERYQGIHVIDNSDPTWPKRLCFLTIPGTVDMSFKDGVLFADNTVDLLAIEVSGTPRLVRRMEFAFEWDPYQCVTDKSVRFPDDVYGKKHEYVVIGAKPRK